MVEPYIHKHSSNNFNKLQINTSKTIPIFFINLKLLLHLNKCTTLTSKSATKFLKNIAHNHLNLHYIIQLQSLPKTKPTPITIIIFIQVCLLLFLPSFLSILHSNPMMTFRARFDITGSYHSKKSQALLLWNFINTNIKHWIKNTNQVKETKKSLPYICNSKWKFIFGWA